LAGRQNDSELVARTLAGDQQAFGELVARYRHAVFGVAFYRLGDFENARDVAQETFLRAYTNLPKLRKPESFASWLYHIADLTALEVARRPRREVLLPSDELLIAAPHASDAATSELAQQVREALATLDEPTRLAVILHYIDGYSHAEVASFLGTTAGAVRTRVSRAKSRLREEIMTETERALKQAVDRAFASLSEKDWQGAIDAVRQSGLPPEKYPDLAYAAGAAWTLLGQKPFNPRFISDGVDLLQRAWESGRRDADTVWQLARTLSNLGEHARIPPILAPRMEETTDPNERVQAGALLAGTWQMLGDYAAAVNAHRTSLAGLGEQADLGTRLDSYLRVALAYVRQGAGLEWLDRTLQLWHSAPENVRTLERAVQLLGAASVTLRDEGRPTERTRELVVQCGEELMRDPRLNDRKDRLSALGYKGRIHVKMFRTYSLAELAENAQAALDTARSIAEELISGAEVPGGDRDAWQDAAFTILHNAGISCIHAGRKQDALALLRQAEKVATWARGLTFFSLAALILDTGGDRQEALGYLRRVAETPAWAYAGYPQKFFLEEPAFAPVRNDPEFLAVINGLREAASQEQH
jgi:RNA polymerase sigma-70 factor (ECF subfamily)